MADEQGAGAAGGTGIAGAMDYRPRTPGRGETVSPVAEVAPGVFRLRAIVEAEARGRAAGLREALSACRAAKLPMHEIKTGPMAGWQSFPHEWPHAIEAAILALLDGAPGGEAPQPADAEAERWWLALRAERRAHDAARARTAELERDVAGLREALEDERGGRQQDRADGVVQFRNGAEAMREAAVMAALLLPTRTREVSVAEATGWMRATDAAASAIRALPLPQEAGE